MKQATPGGSLAIETELDMAITKADNLSGRVAGLVGHIPEVSNKFKLKINLFNKVLGSDDDIKVDELKVSEKLMLSVNTSISVGRILRIHGDEIDFELNVPVICFKGDNVGVARNIGGHWRLIGFGEIVWLVYKSLKIVRLLDCLIKMKDNKISNDLLGVLIGACIGLSSGLWLLNPVVNEAKIFQREQNKPTVMRIYKTGLDSILVEDISDGKYIPINSYLDKIPNESDKLIEEGEIKKAVEWYD